MRNYFSLGVLMAGVLMSNTVLGIPSLRPDYRYYADNQTTTSPNTQTSQSQDTDSTVSEIRQQLMNEHNLNINLINITNKDGKITITGWVNSDKEKARVGEILKNIKSVKSVDNRLQVHKA